VAIFSYVIILNISYATCGLNQVLHLAGLPIEKSYFINVDIAGNASGEAKKSEDELRRKRIRSLMKSDDDFEVSEGNKYSIIMQNGMVYVQSCNKFPSGNSYESFFYDNKMTYQLTSGSSLNCWTNTSQLAISVLFPSYLELLEKSIVLGNEPAESLKAKLALGGGLEKDYIYMLPTPDGKKLFKVLLSEKHDNKAIIEIEYENVGGMYGKILKFEIEECEYPVKNEVFIPNGFGDRKLFFIEEQFELFVRDFLPSPEELNILMVSEDAKREYEAEARNRPRVGPKNKYEKPLDFSQYK
jgi:hypothetical protein